MNPKHFLFLLALTIFWVLPARGQKDYTVRYPIDTLIKLLSTNNYNPENRFIMPELKWEDIPRLLEIGNDQTIITKFPVNVFSSTGLNSCYLGVISLWLIESIRIAELKGINDPHDKFPSLYALLQDKTKQYKDDHMNSISKMETACQAYKTWWQAVKTIDKQDASKINPLENTDLTW